VLFRGFVLSRLRTIFGFANPMLAAALAVAISSLLFGLAHAYQGVLGMLQTFTVGAIVAVIALWRRSIIACIFAHLGIDVIGLVLLKLVKPLLDEYLHSVASQPG